MMRKLLLILTVSIFIGCTAKETGKPINFNGFNTLKVRSLWQLCYHAHMQNVRPANPAFFMLQCDCVVDQTMKDHHADNINKVPNLKEYFTNTNIECAKKVQTDLLNGQNQMPQNVL